MKGKLLLFVCTLAAIAAFDACVKEEPLKPREQKSEVLIDYSAPSFEAAFSIGAEEEDTKTYLGDDDKLYWTANESVSIFTSTTDNQEYVFCGNTGDRIGPLHKRASSQELTGKSIDCNYAAYPYNASNSISEDGVITVTMPERQQFRKNTFDNGSNTMVAVCDKSSSAFEFRNASSYLVLKMYGKVTVSSVTISGNSGEKLSGKADIRISEGNAPSLVMHSDASSSVTLDCGSVALSQKESEATEFWFVLPPVSFSKGFTVSVTTTEGKTFCKSRITSGTLKRNKIVTVDAFNVTTTAGEFLRLYMPEETYDLARIKEMAKEELGDISQYEWLINLAGGLIKTVVLNKIVYTTTDVRGNVVEASGMVAYDKKVTTRLLSKNKYSDILSVQHVTWDIDEAPTAQKIPYEIAAVFKSGVEVAVLADYLGYGASQTADLMHPYMHSESVGNSCADLISAAQSFLSAQKGIKASSGPTIDLVGYSQGAAATISTLLELEKRGRTVGSITCGGGPFDLLRFLRTFTDSPDTPYRRAGFFPFMVRGIDYAENLNLNFHNIYAEEVFTSGTFDRFSSTYTSYWHGRLGTNVRKILHADFFAAENDYNSNPDIKKLLAAMQSNSVVNYTPSHAKKIVLYHSPNDDTVPYDCSVSAKDKWGCTLNNLEKETHDDAAIEFFVKYALGDTIWGLVKDLF